MARNNDEKRKIDAVDRTAEILECIRELGGATVTELAEHTSLTAGTVHTHLTTLLNRRLVRKDGKTYDLSYQFVLLGEYVRNSDRLHRHGSGVADRLADETGEAVHLVVEDDGRGIVLYESFGKNAFESEFYVQNRGFGGGGLHYSAAGKAILAHLGKDRVVEIIHRHGLKERTGETISDAETLFTELEQIRESGYACNDEEGIQNIRAVGAPVLDQNDDSIGAISLSAPTNRLRGEYFDETVPNRIREAANVIERNIHTGDVGGTTYKKT